MTSLIYDLPVGVLGVLLAAMLLGAVWCGRKGLPHYRALVALRTAPEVRLDAEASGVVKIRGVAHPAVVAAGYATPKMVWSEESRSDGTPGHGRSTRSVARILIRDAGGECVIHAEEAAVIPSGKDVDVDQRIFGDDVVEVRRYIRTGDKVVAVGVLGGRKVGQPRRMRRSKQGVLVLSGLDEGRAGRVLRIRVGFAAVGLLACVAVFAWIGWVRGAWAYSM